MLTKLRHNKAHRLSVYLAIFTILVKVMMPLAHANTNANNSQSGFLASLCTSNGFVLISLDINTNDGTSEQAPNVRVTSKCPLCTNLDQDILDTALPVIANVFKPSQNKIFTTSQLLLTGHVLEQKSIRGPPTTSTI